MSEQFNDSTLQDDDAQLIPPQFRSFGGMLALSVFLHLAIAAYLATAPRGIDGPQGSTIDVSLSELATPLATTAMTAPPEEIDDDAEEALPELPPSEEAPAPAVPEPATAATELPPPSSIMFGISSGSFASFGDGLTLKEDIRTYFLEILERVNSSWQKEGVGIKLSSPAVLLLSIDRSGQARGAQILQSSGNSMHDRLLMKAVTNAAPFPAVPDSFVGASFETPLRFTPPLSLMSFGTPATVIPPH